MRSADTNTFVLLRTWRVFSFGRDDMGGYRNGYTGNPTREVGTKRGEVYTAGHHVVQGVRNSFLFLFPNILPHRVSKLPDIPDTTFHHLLQRSLISAL